MAFTGWPPAALEFYRGLEADNSKRYWLEHRHVYDEDVEAPMLELLDELSDEFGRARVFRPYRDVRFSHDKSPYKTTIAAMIGSGYVQLSARGLMAGAGTYHMDTDQLNRYRDAVDDDPAGAELERIVGDLRRGGLEVHASDALKTAPRGFAKDHPRVELLRLKGIVASRSWPAAAWLGTPAAKERVVEVFRASAPLVDWLAGHVGPSTAASSRYG
jgi:uncharacterized protein (TIGR02453 family)